LLTTLRKLHANHPWLVYSLIMALIARLLFILVLDPHPDLAGGDVEFYLINGLKLVQNTAPPLAPAPLYMVYVGLIQLLLPTNNDTIILILRLLNIGWQLAMIACLYGIGLRYFDRRTAGCAAFIIALNPIFIIESGLPLTETVFLTLLILAMWVYSGHKPTLRYMVFIGALFGLATLTRAAVLLFPAILCVHLVYLHGWRAGLRLSVALLLAYGITLSTWTVYNMVKWNRVVIGAEGIVAFSYMGIVGQQSPQNVDGAAGNPTTSESRNQALADQVTNSITHNFLGYLKGRITNLGGALLQPHNTVYFKSESIKELAVAWWRTDRSVAGFIALTQTPMFWPKLSLYVFHFWALIFGAIGMLLCWRHFWPLLPLYGYIGYTLALHSILLALPRYLFPIQPFLIMFATYTTLSLIARLVPTWNSPTPDPVKT
jgi:4-amino-4-deoxy-L-arabinose transferase-like glycosyltransferase